MVKEKMNNEFLSSIFGASSRGDTLEERARTSNLEFVRSQDHLSVAKPTSTGHKLTALQALRDYGLSALEEVERYGSAILACSEDEPAATLRDQREALGLSVRDLAKRTGLTDAEVKASENKDIRSPIRVIEKVAIALGLDDRLVSVEPGAGRDSNLAVRLKTLGKTVNLAPAVVMAFSEASWVIRTQARLLELLGIERNLPEQFLPSSNYGDAHYPAWQHGYYLAQSTRSILGLAADEPVGPLRLICEKLGVPLLHAELPKGIAGATVTSMGHRGIVVNTAGYNRNVWVQRATIAHELGHLLWDPDASLQEVRVDRYDELYVVGKERDKDFVEARANAFAVALLAPKDAVKNEFDKHGSESEGLRAVMDRFGISFTAARFHIWNAYDRSIDLSRLNVEDTEPTPSWAGQEEYTHGYFPLASTSDLRRGEFSAIVVNAEKRGLISVDTACIYLQTTPDMYGKYKESIASLFVIS